MTRSRWTKSSGRGLGHDQSRLSPPTSAPDQWPGATVCRNTCARRRRLGIPIIFIDEGRTTACSSRKRDVFPHGHSAREHLGFRPDRAYLRLCGRPGPPPAGTTLVLHSLVIDVTRDPRWGPHPARPTGEDPYLCGRARRRRPCAVFQGQRRPANIAPGHVAGHASSISRGTDSPEGAAINQGPRPITPVRVLPRVSTLEAVPPRPPEFPIRPPSWLLTAKSTAIPRTPIPWLLKGCPPQRMEL